MFETFTRDWQWQQTPHSVSLNVTDIEELSGLGMWCWERWKVNLQCIHGSDRELRALYLYWGTNHIPGFLSNIFCRFYHQPLNILCVFVSHWYISNQIYVQNSFLTVLTENFTHWTSIWDVEKHIKRWLIWTCCMKEEVKILFCS